MMEATSDKIANRLIESLGHATEDNEYKIKVGNDGRWWIEHKHVGSGEPLKQWLRSEINKELNGNQKIIT